MESIILRPANIDDLALLQHWDEQPHVLASDPNDDWGWETELENNPDWREQLIADGMQNNEIARELSVFRPAFVGPWLVWALAALLVLGVPLAVGVAMWRAAGED